MKADYRLTVYCLVHSTDVTAGGFKGLVDNCGPVSHGQHMQMIEGVILRNLSFMCFNRNSKTTKLLDTQVSQSPL